MSASYSIPLTPVNAALFREATGLSFSAWQNWASVLFYGGTGFYSGAQLARRTGVSQATVSRVLAWARSVGILVEACGQRFLVWTSLFKHKAGLRLRNLEEALEVEGRSIGEILSQVKGPWKAEERSVKGPSICMSEKENEQERAAVTAANSQTCAMGKTQSPSEEHQAQGTGCVAGMDREEWSEKRAQAERSPAPAYGGWRKQTPEEMIASRLGIPVDAVSEEHMPWLDREAMRSRTDRKLLFNKDFCGVIYRWAVADDPRAPFALRKRAEEMRAHSQVLQPHHVTGWLTTASAPTSNENNRVAANTCWEDFVVQKEEEQAKQEQLQQMAQKVEEPSPAEVLLPTVPEAAIAAFQEKSQVTGWQRIAAWEELAQRNSWPTYGKMIEVMRVINQQEKP